MMMSPAKIRCDADVSKSTWPPACFPHARLALHTVS